MAILACPAGACWISAAISSAFRSAGCRETTDSRLFCQCEKRCCARFLCSSGRERLPSRHSTDRPKLELHIANLQSAICNLQFPVPLLDCLPRVQPPFDLLLEPPGRRLVVLAPVELRRQARHVGDGIRLVVRILVSLAVGEILHQWCRRVTKV